MPLNKEKAQDLIDDFVINNNSELNTISGQNPALFDATLNALNFLSARFGTGQKMQIVEVPKVQESGLPFKKGYKFTVPGDKNGWVYTLEDIDITKGLVKIKWWNRDENKSKSYYDSIEVVTKRFNDGHWVLVEWYPLKVGYKFINNNNNKVNYTILNIDESKNKGLEVVLEINGVPKITDYEINDFIDNIELGFFSFIKEEKLPFEIGDVFVTKINGKDERVEILTFKQGTGEVFLNWINDNTKGILSIKDTIEAINKGEWRKIETISQPTTPKPQPTQKASIFELGQILFDVNDEALFAVVDVNGNEIKYMDNSRYILTKDKDYLERQIANGEYLLANFKIGDILENKSGEKFKIININSLNPSEIKLEWTINGNTTIEWLNWNTIDGKVISGEWVLETQPQAQAPIAQAPKPTQNSLASYNLKIGDLFETSKSLKVFELVEIKQDSVKIKSATTNKVNYSNNELKEALDNFELEKLPFSIGSTFVDPKGDFFEIIKLSPNNEKLLVIAQNGVLEVLQWDIIKHHVENANWMPATKAEAKQIKYDYLKGQQAPKPTKPPKKTLTKEEKAIKNLQKEIDGLEVLAEFDDEAKDELKIKKQELNALKAKK